MNGDFLNQFTTSFDTVQPIPAARPLSDFAVERVGDDLVILDGETMQYHTLNLAAAQIWQACDGARNSHQIAERLGLPVELVESTVSELGEAGLLQSPSNRWDSALNRRRASKLIAAGLLGAVGLPAIKSITVPDAASAASQQQCIADGYIGACALFSGECRTTCRANGYRSGVCVPQLDGSGIGCCSCLGALGVGGANSAIYSDDSVLTADFGEESIPEDPYLATDEEGNVDLEAIDAQTAEQSGQAPESQTGETEIVEEVAPVEVDESQPEPTEVVDTSSDGEEATTDEQSGQ